MLTQYKLTLQPEKPCSPRPEWAYRLYAALLAETSQDFAASVHQSAVTPVSQFLLHTPQGLQWTINLLGEESEAVLAPVIDRLDRIWLEKDRVVLLTEKRSSRMLCSADELFALAAQGNSQLHRLRFCTPTCFKSVGQYLPLPTTRLIVQSLMKKWNGCISECPIEDEDGQGMETLAAGLRPRGFQLCNRNYYLKGNSIPGFVGELNLDNRLNGFHRELADALLLFADFAGIGIKTTLGMGGVVHITHT